MFESLSVKRSMLQRIFNTDPSLLLYPPKSKTNQKFFSPKPGKKIQITGRSKTVRQSWKLSKIWKNLIYNIWQAKKSSMYSEYIFTLTLSRQCPWKYKQEESNATVLSDVPPLTRTPWVKNVHFMVLRHETLVVCAAKSCRTRAPPNSSGKHFQFYWSEVLKPVLRIRIGFNADPATLSMRIQIRIQIQGVDDQNWKTISAEKKFTYNVRQCTLYN